LADSAHAPFSTNFLQANVLVHRPAKRPRPRRAIAAATMSVARRRENRVGII
jgi:hypothetical protein